MVTGDIIEESTITLETVQQLFVMLFLSMTLVLTTSYR